MLPFPRSPLDEGIDYGYRLPHEVSGSALSSAASSARSNYRIIVTQPNSSRKEDAKGDSGFSQVADSLTSQRGRNSRSADMQLLHYVSEGRGPEERYVPLRKVTLNYSCAICSKSMRKGENVVGMLCGHLFHEICLAKQEGRTDCPLCPGDVVSAP